jgi:hypothetical protein
MVRALASDPESPALVLFPADNRAFGVLMPFRCSDVQEVPDWFNQVPKLSVVAV